MVLAVPTPLPFRHDDDGGGGRDGRRHNGGGTSGSRTPPGSDQYRTQVASRDSQARATSRGHPHRTLRGTGGTSSRNLPSRSHRHSREQVRRAILEQVSTNNTPYAPRAAIGNGPAVFVDDIGNRIASEPNFEYFQSRGSGRPRRRASLVAHGTQYPTPEQDPVEPVPEEEITLDLFAGRSEIEFASVGSNPTVAFDGQYPGYDSDLENEEQVASIIQRERRTRAQLQAFDFSFNEFGSGGDL